MNKRSKLLMIVSIILVIALLSTLFVGCKDKDKGNGGGSSNEGGGGTNPPEEEEISAEDVMDAVSAAYKKAGFDNLPFTTMKLDVNLAIEGGVKGQTAKKYNLNAKVGLGLLESWNNGTLYAEDKKGSDILVNSNNYIDLTFTEEGVETFKFFYDNRWAPTSAFLKAGTGADTQKFQIKAPDVAKTINQEFNKAGITINGKDSNIQDEAIQEFVNESLPGYLKLGLGMVGVNPQVNANDGTASIEIPLSELLKSDGKLGTILGAFSDKVNSYLALSGVLSTTGEGNMVLAQLLNEVVPYLNVKINFAGLNGAKPVATLSAVVGEENNNGEIKFAPAAAGSITEKVGKTDVTVNYPADDFDNMVNGKAAGIYFVAPSVEGKLALTVKGGANAGAVAYPTALDSYKLINAVNVSLSADLDWKTALNLPIKNDKQETILTLNIPKALYKINVDLDVNPVGLIGKDFTSMDKIITAVSSGVVNYANISMVNTATKANFVKIELYNKGGLKANLDLTGLGFGNLGEMDLQGVIDFVLGKIGNSFKTPSVTVTTDTTTGEKTYTWAEVKDVKDQTPATAYDVTLINPNADNTAALAEQKLTPTVTKKGDVNYYSVTVPAVKDSKGNIFGHNIYISAAKAGDIEASGAWKSENLVLTKTDAQLQEDKKDELNQKADTFRTVRQALCSLLLNVDCTPGQEKVIAKYANTEFNAWGFGAWDVLFFGVEVDEVKLDSTGLSITNCHLYNGIREGKTEKLDDKIDILFDLKNVNLSYGTVVAPKAPTPEVVE